MEHLKQIERILQKYTKSYHFYLRDLRNNAEFELGEKKRYPICSCFKLAVLMAFFDSLESEEQLFEEVTIEPKDFSPGVGIINYSSRTFRGTKLSLAQMMMSFSDGTATDFLIKQVGISNVNSYLKLNRPISTISTDLREMVTRFQAKYPVAQLRENKFSSFEFEDATNAIELESLAKDAYSFNPKRVSRHLYLECLDVRKMLGRTALFFGDKVKSIGKTGSIGFGYFANDCGVLLHRGELVASFGITSEGFTVDKDLVEIIFGLIGLNVLEHLKISEAPNIRYSNQTRLLIEPK